jgi:dTDP-4-amino-4,6-dideoxygalactose transaminase
MVLLMSKEARQPIAFNEPTLLGNEVDYIRQVLEGDHASGNGRFTALAQAEIERQLGGGHVLLTTSCTSALEMAAILAGVEPGDEVIMPSFTFTSAANAVVLRGAKPVFIDIRPDTLNIDEGLIKAAITPKTKAITVMHYAGVGCEMDQITEIADANNLVVVEDAAQAFGAFWRGQPLGRQGALSAFSFHETKNIIAGEGGALVVNKPNLVDRAEIIWEKGTNRVKFKRGEVSRYNWVDVGGSYLPSELTAAFLYAQLQQAALATERRLKLWQRYYDAFKSFADADCLSIPQWPSHTAHNGHIFYLLAPTAEHRKRWLTQLSINQINAPFHYVPLHSSPAGRRFGRVQSDMTVTDNVSSRLFRLPLHLRLTHEVQDIIIEETHKLINSA